MLDVPGLNCSLTDILTRGVVGQFEIGATRDSVALVLGDQAVWDGALTLDDATIWRFGAVQFNFDASFVVETIHVFFTYTIASRAATLTFDFAPLEFVDSSSDMASVVYLDGFRNLLRSRGIDHELATNEIRQPVVCTGSSTATRFAKHTDQKLSRDAERPIYLNDPVVFCSTVYAPPGRPTWFCRKAPSGTPS